MTGSRRAREIWIMVAVTVASCLGTIGLTIALTGLPGIQSAARGYAGEAFGAAASASSVVVLIYIARTFHQQGEVAGNQHETARRIAEAAIREQHRKLIQMAIEDPTLMEIWPIYSTEVSENRDLHKQFMYANLVISFQWMCWETGYLVHSEIETLLDHLFTSPKMREFWEKTRGPRDRSSPHEGGMREFYDVCEMAYQRQLLDLTARPDPDNLTEPR